MKKLLIILIINFISIISFSQNSLVLQKIHNIIKKENTNTNISFNKYAKVLVIDIDESEYQFDLREIFLKYSEKLSYDDTHKGGYAWVNCIKSTNKLNNCITITPTSAGEVTYASGIPIKLNSKLDFNLLNKYIFELTF
jgi:hypothetical protein